MGLNLTNEVFALRHGEVIQLFIERPESGRFLAVQARTVEFPDGPVQATRPGDGAPVERAAIVCCEWINNQWQWCQLSPQTKEAIGDHMFDNGVKKDTWYYLSIEQS